MLPRPIHTDMASDVFRASRCVAAEFSDLAASFEGHPCQYHSDCQDFQSFIPPAPLEPYEQRVVY